MKSSPLRRALPFLLYTDALPLLPKLRRAHVLSHHMQNHQDASPTDVKLKAVPSWRTGYANACISQLQHLRTVAGGSLYRCHAIQSGLRAKSQFDARRYPEAMSLCSHHSVSASIGAHVCTQLHAFLRAEASGKEQPSRRVRREGLQRAKTDSGQAGVLESAVDRGRNRKLLTATTTPALHRSMDKGHTPRLAT